MSFPSSFDLSTLDGSNGFTLNGIDSNDKLGFAVSGVGDINGDGIDDLIVGAPFADPNSNSEAGESYVLFGSSAGFSSSFDLSTLNGLNGFVIDGVNSFDRAGRAVNAAGDVNGDGIEDLVVGAYRAAGSIGKSYVIFGATSGFSDRLDLSTLNGTNGFVINGIDANDLSGRSVSSAGDFNGDDIDDLIIGAHAADPNGNQSGESYVVFGSSGGFSASFNLSNLNGSNGFVINGAEGESGFSVSSAGDVNADGFDDLIIGAPESSPGSRFSAGESYVVFGSNGSSSASIELASLDGTNGFVIPGIDSGDASGFAVSRAGDINGDGVDDLIIGAPYAASRDENESAYAGESYVIFGSASGFSDNFDLSTLDGTNGFTILGIGSIHGYSGSSVSGAGDINGDGIDDLIIGAPYAKVNSNVYTGESYVVFGSREGFSDTVSLESLDGDNGFIVKGLSSNDSLGIAVDGVGDINNDGIDDLIVGAVGSDANGKIDAGESYVVFGIASEAQPGDVVINEILQNPAAVSDSNGEWFELFNTTSADIDINGWTISDNGSDSHTIDKNGPLIISSGGFLVLGIDSDLGTNGGVEVDYQYDGFILSNSDDEIVLTSDKSIEIDRVEYDGGSNFPDPSGISMSLISPTLDNAVGVNWELATVPFGDSDLGTPGVANRPNTAPITGNVEISSIEDTAYVFNSSLFPFSDIDHGDALQSVRITALPTVGNLFLDADDSGTQDGNEAIVQDQEILVSSLNQLKFLPELDANGIDYASFQFQVSDGNDFSQSSTGAIAVTAVNDQPSFSAAVLETTDENSGLVTVSDWATFSPGAGDDEATQTATYLVSGLTNSELFSITPSIDESGVLTYTPAADTAGTATFNVSVQDSGGTTNGGVDTSEEETFTIIVKGAPGVVFGQLAGTVSEDGETAAYTVALASQPTANVSLTLNGGEELQSLPSLNFTPETWSQAQTVTVSAIDDTENESQHTSTISYSVSSEDDAYDGLAIASTTIEIIDNDRPTEIVFTFEQYIQYQAIDEGINPDFDENLYLLANPDVQAAVAAGFISSGTEHYTLFGAAEGRPTLPLELEIGGLKLSALFDETYYLSKYSDVAGVVNQGIFSYGFEHFLQFGIAEGRNPSSYYDESLYLANNPDVAGAVDSGVFSSGLLHYVLNGHAENRVASDLFNAGDYLSNNPGVQADIDGGIYTSAFDQFLDQGAEEGQLSSLLFEEAFYLAQNPDVAGVVAAGHLASGFDHYVGFGQKEGRDPSSLFSESAYLEANPDLVPVISGGILSSGMEHYFRYGRAESRPLG